MPLNLLTPGAQVPVDVCNPQGQLLLRRGEKLVDAEHVQRLRAHKPCIRQADARAWQRAYERAVQQQLRQPQAQIGDPMALPATIEDQDYDEQPTHHFKGGWLDAQEVLRVLLFHGGLAMDPMPRLRMIEERATQWLDEDADDSLLSLFQALATPALGYCATHALLCLAITELTAQKLGLDADTRRALRYASLTMNIGIGRIQDAMAQQTTPLTPAQRAQVQARPQISHYILVSFGMDEPRVLDLVRWHHDAAHPQALSDNLLPRLVLQSANRLVAQMAARPTRSSLVPKNAERTLYTASQDADSTAVSAAMAAAVSFFPPGSYVVLHNGHTAVSVRRGMQANKPWVVPIIDAWGMPVAHYSAVDTAEHRYQIARAINFEKVRLGLNLDKIRRARDRLAVSPITVA